jgi:uncharacterized membrane protein
MTPLAKRLAIALTLSVGVNLLLAGYVLGYGLRRPQTTIGTIGAGNGPAMGMGRGMGRGPGMGMGHAMGSCPGMGNGTGCRRPALRAALGLREDDVRTYREEIDKARDNVRVALEHDPLDRLALEQALATLRTQSGRGQELTHQAIVDSASRATLEQRRELANEFGTGNR